MIEKDVVIIGGGPAGLSAACQLFENGIKNILILEREQYLGGILRQCIHDGFGNLRFGESLSGPEYAQKMIDIVQKNHISYLTKAAVIEIRENKEIVVSTKEGLLIIRAQSILLCMGCRERTRGSIAIAGKRLAGVFTAGLMQNYMNLHNLVPAKEVVILGSGDIGLIMARRLTLEGVKVKAVYEIENHPNGLPRNIQQCLDDYHIPLFLSHTVVGVHGNNRVEAITVAKVDRNKRPIKETIEKVSCDALVLSVGLIPENDLLNGLDISIDSVTGGPKVDDLLQTEIKGIFSAGNSLHVHDLVDFVSIEAERAADNIAKYLRKEIDNSNKEQHRIIAGNSIRYVLPQVFSGNSDFTISFRSSRWIKDEYLVIRQKNNVVLKKKIGSIHPSQMMRIELKSSKILKDRDMEVTVEA